MGCPYLYLQPFQQMEGVVRTDERPETHTGEVPDIRHAAPWSHLHSWGPIGAIVGSADTQHLWLKGGMRRLRRFVRRLMGR